jgi:hypothetical protein
MKKNWLEINEEIVLYKKIVNCTNKMYALDLGIYLKNSDLSGKIR